MKAITFCSQGRLVVCHYVTAASAPHFCTVKSFPHYQYMLRKVGNQGKSQYSSFCRVEQQALCHRTSINHLSSLRRCTLSLNTVLVALTHFTNIVFRLAWYTLHGMHFFWYSGIGSTDVQKFDLRKDGFPMPCNMLSALFLTRSHWSPSSPSSPSSPQSSWSY